jgi:hypothetical protein
VVVEEDQEQVLMQEVHLILMEVLVVDNQEIMV